MRFARIVAATACLLALLPPSAGSAATRGVDIPARYFSPQRVTITVGSTVRWTNASNERHSIRSTSASNDQFTSSNNCPGGFLFNDCLRPGESFDHTFVRSGTYTYFCTIHGSDGSYPNCGMCGRVVVKKKASASIAPVTPGSVSPTATGSSPSPTPTISGSPLTSASATTPIAGGPNDGSGPSTLVAIAALAVALLGGTGVIVYRTMIRR